MDSPTDDDVSIGTTGTTVGGIVVPVIVAVATVLVLLLCQQLRCCLFSNPNIIKPSGGKCPPFPPADAVPATGDILKRGLKKKILPRQADVIIIGAGASGLATAALLSRYGCTNY